MSTRPVVEQESDLESWLLPFADMVTFLMAFFVILYSIQQVSPEKAQRIKEAVSTSMEVLVDGGDSTNRPLTVQEKYRRIMGDIESAMIEAELQTDLTVRLAPEGLLVTASSELLFPSGSDAMNDKAREVLQSIAAIIISEPVDIRVEGHTDDLAINTTRFPTNWELSSARAIAVLKQLNDSGIESTRLSATGYADTRPLTAINESAENIIAARAENRRVVLMLTRNDLGARS